MRTVQSCHPLRFSPAPVATRLPSLVKAPDRTWAVCPVSRFTSEPRMGSHRLTVIQVAGTTTVSFQFGLPVQSSTAFNLTGLPLGTDTFTASAFSVPCAQVATATATWISDPIVTNVTASTPVNITFVMRLATTMGQGVVGLDFGNGNAGQVTAFRVPTANSEPFSIVPGPDGALWFTELQANQIGRVTTAGAITEFPLPSTLPNSNPVGIAVGADGNFWFTDVQFDFPFGAEIGRMTPTGEVTLFPNASGLRICSGPDGNVWFTDSTGNNVGRITPSGIVTLFAIPTPAAEVAGITAGADGNLWFVERLANQIGRVTPSGNFAEFGIPIASFGNEFLTGGADGNVWFADGGGHIGRVAPSGSMVEFATSTLNGGPEMIATGPDGNVWFNEGTTAIARITTLGSITEFPLSNPVTVGGIAAGSDGNIWFTDETNAQIVRLIP
jgi:virginiamycin B lyase